MENLSNTPTLSNFVMSNQGQNLPLTILMNSIALSCKSISTAVKRAGISNLYGLAGEVNATGDDQKKLDILSNDIMVNALKNSGVCSVLVSEENEDIIICPNANSETSKYVVAFDPLDGSSNIDCNVSVGTIFGVYEKTPGEAGLKDALRRGDDMVCAGYCVYSSAVELVLTFKNGGVHCFCLDPSIGEFVHTRKNMQFPEGGGKKIYSCNEGNSQQWDKPILDSASFFKGGAKPYSARYCGSMVADVHRTLLYGGIFMYPADKKSTKGKLRILYEGYPMAMIIEQAKGVASTGLFRGTVGRIMEVVPEHIHDRCPIIMGSPRDVEVVYGFYRAAGVDAPELE